MRRKVLLMATVGVSLALAACSTGAKSSSGSNNSASAPSSSGATGRNVIDQTVTGTRGPNGESPTPVTDLTFTPDELAKLKAGNFKSAMFWLDASPFFTAVQNGAAEEFKRLGIDVVATGQAKDDAGTQANQIQTAMAKKPDVIISLPVDPTSAGAAFKPAVDAGTKLVFLSNIPAGYTYGKEYQSLMTDDLFEMGRQAAEALGKSLGGKGKVGILFFNSKFYVTNQRDAAFKSTLAAKFPDIKVVAEQGFTNPSDTNGIASAMIAQNPDLDGVYSSWSQPGEGILAALRTAGNTHAKFVSLDLDDPVIIDMVTGGRTVAVVVDKAWDLGVGMADAAAYALLGKKAPEFGVVGATTITKDNVADGYQQTLHQPVPEAVKKAMK
ncbi:MAG: LacI family transcriptional regulator [Dactylosporangium sp.]|nr:LacI family transcriptional regulator [Dactylosporangium sp.]